MWDWMHGYGWGGGMLLMALFWIILVVAFVVLARGLWGRPPAREGPGGHLESPLEILQRRYARGEIDRAEYEEKRRDLS